MCGLAGFLDSAPGRPGEEMSAVAEQMADTLRHRGPDDSGVWLDEEAGYAVGFRRLSIVDLSPEGAQPMISSSGRFVIAFNGEVYNHRELRRRLEQRPSACFRGHSDTEVLLTAIEAWGLEEAVRRSVGMFAFALWDRRERVLHLCRDRMGEKPLYYGWLGSTFFFGSELKALKPHPQFNPEINRDVLIPYLRHGYVPAPWSIYRNICKLVPGTLLSVRAADRGKSLTPAPYWSVREAAETGFRRRLQGSREEIIAQLEEVLRRSVGEQMVADVPLGAFLSGGVDSSAIVALMQAQSSRPVKTYTIGFDESEFNEAEHAQAVAKHLGTEHTELYVNGQEALDVIPRLPQLYDEPFADSSQIPTFLVAQMARRHVTVSLSGDGGDEVFAGYHWYQRCIDMWKRIRCTPPPVRILAGRALRSVSPGLWNRFLDPALRLAPGEVRRRVTGDRLHKMSGLFAQSRRVEALHRSLIAFSWNFDEEVVVGAREPMSALNDPSAWPRAGGALEKLQCFDMQTFLPDDILVKVDRATMGVSLESRAPLLDHRVIEFVLRAPAQLKIRRGTTKWLLRQVLYRHVPKELIERPKSGFSIPLAAWLRGPLQDWAEGLLDPRTLANQGFFKADIIRRIWSEHCSGRRDWHAHLWNVLMFQAWLD